MSVLGASVGFVHHGAAALLDVADPQASAPPDLEAKVMKILGVVKWVSIVAVLGLLLAAGAISVAGDRGYGGGMSSELKGTVMKAVMALIVIASAAPIVNFVME